MVLENIDVPIVSVIIPTRGKVDLVEKCLTALFETKGDTPIEVVVLEHGGEDSKALIESRFSDKPVRWMKSEEEWSYSEINNAGAKATSAAYILLLNNDTVPKPRFLDEMIIAMNSHPKIGIVGCKQTRDDGAIQHIGVTIANTGRPYHLGWGKMDDGSYEPARRDDFFDAVTFSCVLIQRSIWEELGGLDERYFFNYEDTDFCLRALEKGWKSFVTMKALVTHSESKSIEFRRTEKHTVERNFAIFKEIWITTGRMQKIVTKKLEACIPGPREDAIKIAFVSSGKDSGVPWWRLEIPARKIVKKKMADVRMLYGDKDPKILTDILMAADVSVFQGFSSEWVRRIAGQGLAREQPMVYDYDDHPIYMSPFAEVYRHFGTAEIPFRMGNETGWLWRDGESGFDLKKNLELRQNQLEVFHLADMVTTTTKPLLDYFSTLNPNVRILPNFIDFDIYQHQYSLWERRPGPVRIGWHGGDNHYHDMITIGKELTEFVNSHDVELVLFGAWYKGTTIGIDESKVIDHPWVHIEAFPAKLATLGIDVAVIPLADPNDKFMKFNRFKSDIKFLEYSALRVPSLVAADREAYDTCEDEDNCLTYSSGAEFTEKLEELVKDKELRERIGTRALEWVRENKDLDKNVHLWIQAYQFAIDNFKERREAAFEIAEEIPEEQFRMAASNAVSE